MLTLSLLLLLLPQVPPPQPQETTAPPTTAPVYDEGPFRTELIAMREMRLWASDPTMAARMESDLRMQLRVRGSRLKEISRFGNVILTELVDDTGRTLIDEKTYSEADKIMTHIMTVPPERLRENGLPLVARVKPSTRGSRTLKTLRGDVRLILAQGELEKLTVVHPAQFVGKTIPDPRLKALGIEVEVVASDQTKDPIPGERTVILWYKTKGENIQNATFYDGSLRPIPARDTPVTKATGEPCTAYFFEAGTFNDEMQVVFEVHPQVEDLHLPILMENVDLP